MPADLRHQAAFHEIDALVRGHEWPTAGDRLKEATKTAAAGAPRDRLAICQIVVTAAQSPKASAPRAPAGLLVLVPSVVAMGTVDHLEAG